MTPPTLLEMTREIYEAMAKDGGRCICGNSNFMHFPERRRLYAELGAAIAAEEAKVERVQLPNKFMGEFSPEWRLYAERPVPAPASEPSIEERLEHLGACEPGTFVNGTYIQQTIKEAAAEIRRLRGKKE